MKNEINFIEFIIEPNNLKYFLIFIKIENMNFNQFLKTAKQSIMIVYWGICLFITFVLSAIAEDNVNLILIVCLSILNFYITITWRNNKYVFGFMTISVIFVVIILFLADSSKTKNNL